MTFAVRSHLGNEKIVVLANPRKVAAGDYGGGIVRDTHRSSDAVMHLMYYTLK